MKKLIISVALLFSLITSAQQTYKLNSKGKLESTTEVNIPKFKNSGYTLDLKDSTYVVYISTKGKYFINRVSGKTGKIYKQYITVE